jgi:hypothetical protein
MIIRDFYFAAWAIDQGHGYQIEGGFLNLEVDTVTMQQLQLNYKPLKPYFNRVRKLIREVNASRKEAHKER